MRWDDKLVKSSIRKPKTGCAQLAGVLKVPGVVGPR